MICDRGLAVIVRPFALGFASRFTPVFRAKGGPSLAGDRQRVNDARPAAAAWRSRWRGCCPCPHYARRLAARFRNPRLLLTMRGPLERPGRARDGPRSADGVGTLRRDKRVGWRGSV